LIGIATATKYNGLAVGIAFLVAHFVATKGENLRRMILNRQFGLGWAWLCSDFTSDAQLRPMSRKILERFHLQLHRHARYSGHRTAPIILELLVEFRKFSEFPAQF